MTRDLPFDDGAARAEGSEGSDTAYRIANGVARVARAGAYVTGGALVAANGTQREPGTSNADSRYAGWSQQTVPSDPSPDAPSPIVTFPDLAAELPPLPVVPHAPVFAPPNPVASMVAAPDESVGRPETPDSDGDESSSGLGIPGYGYTQAGSDYHDTQNPLPGATPDPGFDLPGFDGLPGDGGFPGFDLPGTGNGLPGFDGLPGGGIGIPGFDGLPGHGFGIPGYDSVGLPNGNLPGAHAPGGMFDGIGNLDGAFDGFAGMFDGVGAMVTTDWQVDVHVGLDGVWATSQMKLDVQVGQVGDQLDDYGQWLGGGLKVPGDTPSGSGLGTSSSAGTGTSSSGAPGLPGSSSSGLALPGTPAPAPALAAPAAPVAATPFAAAPAQAPAPVAPVPAPIAPAAPAPAAFNPVVSTPLQTTIQPDAASTPIANVFGNHAPSPLTAPAASLFTPPAPTKPVVLPEVSGGGHTPTTVPVPVPSKIPTVDLDTPTTVKVPTVTVPTVPEITKVPITVPTTGQTVPPKPTTPDDDITTKPGTSTGVTTPSTGGSTPTVDVPSPTTPHPTPSVPTQQPTAPTKQPTVDIDPPTKQPTVDIDPPTVHVPPPVTVAPTVVPVKPPVIETKPIAAEFDHHDSGYHGVSAGLFDPGMGGGDVLAAAFPIEHHGYDFVV
ncbi:hypothetical protein [Nocardia alba]|uniref:Uncharacterized protein n=1 Tax=Nocardia alba TaxID=225051 RepID=A0A4V2PAI7_9NOCA|nr:hypothetical protein [Nocardia alba]TCJ93645.1 hypothetical protein DFR71_5495 [Nocardia alba]